MWWFVNWSGRWRLDWILDWVCGWIYGGEGFSCADPNDLYVEILVFTWVVIPIIKINYFFTHPIFGDLDLWGLNFFFFLRESFNLWYPLLMSVFYHQTKTQIGFWCRWRLNPRSLIQPSKILPVELTGIH